MKNFSKLLLALCTVMILTACAQKNSVEQGTPLTREKVDNIVEGSTTEAQILSLFGEPTSKKVINNNEAQWTYKYTKKSSTSHPLIGETQYDIVEDTLDLLISKGTVTWFNYDENRKQKKW